MHRSTWALFVRLCGLAIAAAAAACVPPETDKFSCAKDLDCVDGYLCVSKVCVSKSDPCVGFDCGHGTCANVGGAAKCTCAATFAGATCADCATGLQDKDSNGTCLADCATAALTCPANQVCSDASGTAACGCAEGYTGTDCAECATGWQDKDGDKTCAKDCATAGLACGANGTCSDTSGTAKCQCGDGYAGDACETCAEGWQDKDGDKTCAHDCATSGLSCNDHGTCTDASGTAKCECGDGYTGDNCDLCAAGWQDNDANGTCEKDCASAALSCGIRGACSDASGVAACKCTIGYAGAVCDVCAAGFTDDFGVCKAWTRMLGGSQSYERPARGMVSDPDGNLYFGGGFSGITTIFGGETTDRGAGDGFLMSVDPAGNRRWFMHIGGPARDGVSQVIRDAQGNILYATWVQGQTLLYGDVPVVVTGGEAILAAKVTKDGVFQWSKSWGGGNGAGIATDGAGNAYVVGFQYGSIDLGNGPSEAFGSSDLVLIALDPQGNHRWSRTFGGPGGDGMSAVTADADGNVYVGGTIFGSAPLGDEAIGEPRRNNIVLASFTSAGRHRWSKAYVAEVDRTGNISAMTMDRRGRLAVSFAFNGTITVGDTPYTPSDPNQTGAVFAILDPATGAVVAHHGVTTGVPITVNQLSFDDANNLHVVGNANNGGADFGGGVPVPPALSGGAFYASYDSNLGFRKIRFAASGAYPIVFGVVPRRDGAVYLLGDTGSSIDWGTGVKASNGFTDMWLNLLIP